MSILGLALDETRCGFPLLRNQLHLAGARLQVFMRTCVLPLASSGMAQAGYTPKSRDALFDRGSAVRLHAAKTGNKLNLD